MTVPGSPGELTLDSGDLDAQAGGEPLDAAALAKAAAAAAMKGLEQPQDTLGVTHQGVEGEVEETPEAQAQKAAQEAAAAAAQAEGTTEEEGPEVSLEEIQEALAEAGIDLGIEAKDVPKELMPAYMKMVQSAVDVAQNTLEKQMEASKMVRAITEFSEQLKMAPDKVMLALAMNQPEVYKKVAQTMTDAEADPRVKDMILRELAAEAQLREAQRLQRTVEEGAKRQKANQVIAATQRAARAYQVPFNTAEKVIALAVQANNGDLEVSEVDGIVRELKGLAPIKPKTPGIRIASPQKQAAVKQAPTEPIAGSETAQTVQGRQLTVKGALIDKTGDREGGGGKFRALIQSINQRLSQER